MLVKFIFVAFFLLMINLDSALSNVASISESSIHSAAPIYIDGERDILLEQSKFERRELNERPDAIRLIDREEIQAKSASHISDLLRGEPNVEFVGGANSPAYNRLQIRGLEGERIRVDVDGARRIEQTQAAMSTDLGIDPESLNSITVQRGADSTRYGSGALGGAVRARSVRARDFYRQGQKKVGGRVSVGGDTATEGQMWSATAYGPAHNKVDILGQYVQRESQRFSSGKDQQGQREDQDQSTLRRNLLFRSDVSLRVRETLGVKAELTQSEVKETSYTSWTDDQSTNQKIQRQEYNLIYENNGFSSPLFDIDGNIYVSRTNSIRDVVTPFRDIPSTVGKTTDKQDLWGANLKNTSVMALSSDHRFSLISENLLFSEGQTLEEIEGIGETSYYGKSRGTDLAIGTLNEVVLWGGLSSLHFGARYDRYSRRSIELAEDASDNSDSFVSRSLGLTIRPIEGLSVFGKMGDSFRSPSLRELYQGGGESFPCHFPRKECKNIPNSQLDSEVASTREVGISIFLEQQFNRPLNLDFKITYFKESIRDYIQRSAMMYRLVGGERVLAGPSTATHREYMATNQSLVERQGIEGQVRADFYQLSVGGSYSAMRADCVDCVDMFNAQNISEPLPSSPAHRLGLNLGYQFRVIPVNFSVSGTFVSTQNRLSERYKNAGYITSGYQNYAAKISYHPKMRGWGELEAHMAMDNILDKRYRVHGSPTGNDELGRNIKLGLTATF